MTSNFVDGRGSTSELDGSRRKSMEKKEVPGFYILQLTHLKLSSVLRPNESFADQRKKSSSRLLPSNPNFFGAFFLGIHIT